MSEPKDPKADPPKPKPPAKPESDTTTEKRNWIRRPKAAGARGLCHRRQRMVDCSIAAFGRAIDTGRTACTMIAVRGRCAGKLNPAAGTSATLN